MAVIRIDNTKHEYMYSESMRKWILISCSCDPGSSRCPAPATVARGNMKNCTTREATEEDYTSFEAIMQALEGDLEN